MKHSLFIIWGIVSGIEFVLGNLAFRQEPYLKLLWVAIDMEVDVIGCHYK